jgi:hypothetical protein
MAAALIHAGADSRAVAAVLLEPSAAELRFGPDSVMWRNWTIGLEGLAATRRFFRSFGSCAFREPVDELERLCLL